MKSFNSQADSSFAADVRRGLTHSRKHLSSKFIYDARGDALFQQIMKLPEYYLTRKESEIIDTNKQKLAELWGAFSQFQLIDLGAGDGEKTKILLRHFLKEKLNFTYVPVDISTHALSQLQKSLEQEFPQLRIHPQSGTYLETLKKLKKQAAIPKVILFLGSNIGNFQVQEAENFLRNLRSSMGNQDVLFLGADQIKDPSELLAAYHDPQGISAAFNKNILLRINKELGGQFDLDNFKHWPIYDPEKAVVRSFLVSTRQQNVRIEKLDLLVRFHQWESIHTEVSQKFNDSLIRNLSRAAGLKIGTSFSDPQQYFKNYLLQI